MANVNQTDIHYIKCEWSTIQSKSRDIQKDKKKARVNYALSAREHLRFWDINTLTLKRPRKICHENSTVRELK